MAKLVIDFNTMLNYLPPFWHENEEMRQILSVHEYEFNEALTESEIIIQDAFILTMSEDRVKQWEKALGLPPNGTLEERRMAVLGYFSVIAKLTEESIKAMAIRLYDGARARIKFEDSTIKVEVVPLPKNYETQVAFPLLREWIYEKKPCHIALEVERYYTTWGEVKNDFSSWGKVVLQKTWQDVILFIPN